MAKIDGTKRFVNYLPTSVFQPHHQQAHRREPRRLLLPQHLFPHGHLQVRALRDRQPPRGREQPDGAPVGDPGDRAARRRRRQQRGQTLPVAGEQREKPAAEKDEGVAPPRIVKLLFGPQWICCDIRYLDMAILGKFSVVMADPPWDIHMELPYGTLTDDEMRKLSIPALQDDGFLFLWVTGR